MGIDAPVDRSVSHERERETLAGTPPALRRGGGRRDERLRARRPRARGKRQRLGQGLDPLSGEPCQRGCAGCADRPRCRERAERRRRRADPFERDPRRESRAPRRARARPPRPPPRRPARRVHRPEAHDCRCRRARQDHHLLDDRPHPARGRIRSQLARGELRRGGTRQFLLGPPPTRIERRRVARRGGRRVRSLDAQPACRHRGAHERRARPSRDVRLAR